MRRLFHNCKGAVTVMVTLLLIPAILVSGTGVDMARIYSARSIVQDANQLAANSVLASYEALLQDLYGLYGVMNDGNCQTDQYVKWAVEGSGWDKGLGTFQIFYGSNIHSQAPVPTQFLGETPVLRRQIEEYSKLRAPAVIAELLMDKLDVFKKIQEDAKVIKKKLEVDDGVEELEKYYKKIYNHLKALENCGRDEADIMQDLSGTAAEIQNKLRDMQDIKEEYSITEARIEELEELLSNTKDEERRQELEDEIKSLKDDLERLEMEYKGKWTLIQRTSKGWQDRQNGYIKTLSRYRDEVDALARDCDTAEEKKKDLETKIQELRSSLQSGKCSNTLHDGLTKPEEGSPDSLSILDRYDALLKYDIAGMGNAMYDHNYVQISQTLDTMREARLGENYVRSYREISMNTWFPLRGSDHFAEVVDAPTGFRPHVMPDGRAYIPFENIKPPESQRFWDELKTLYDNTEGKGANKKKLEKAVTSIFKEAQKKFKKLFDNFEPEGAEHLAGAANTAGGETGSKFGTENDWNSKDEGKKEMEDSLDGDFLKKLADTAGKAGDKLLILIYDTEMFSDFSTPGKDDAGYPKENMAGIPLSTDVNYYFQSELEYLYNGNLADAKDNLKSVAGMMLLVRFVLDYVASFSVQQVNQIVTGVKSALAWTGPFSILAGELARLSLSIGEAAIDVTRLRDSEEVAVFKNNNTWRLSISGLVKAATNELSEDAIKSAFDAAGSGGSDSADSSKKDEGITMGYQDYMRLFLLLVPGDTLGERTKELIQLNVTNKKNRIGANEEKSARESAMANAERYRLDNLFTSFELTTSVDLRMLFLSMPAAQQGVNGVIPPKTLTLTATEYRGY